MNADRLLEHYERIADAPEAIPRLRRFILDLAVRGKLVPQDPQEESASELLKRIAAEKARLVKAGEFNEPSSFVQIQRDDLPFAVPNHWQWTRLIEIAKPSYGFAFPSGQFNLAKRGTPLIRIRDISATDTEAYFEGDYDPAHLVKAGDYLVGMDGDFNLRQWRGKDGLLNQRVLRLNGWRCSVDPEFFRLPLQFILDHLHGETSLTTVKHLSAKQVNGIEVPLPPLAEQYRIVAKVDELMALCDRLEAARAGREAVRDRLAAASLAHLNAPDPATFQDDARFALDTLPDLTTRPDQIKQLRQTILNLAVRGKLVPQDPNDEPALELLKRIAGENKKLLSAKGIRSQKPALPAENFEVETEIPASWRHAYLQDLAYQITDGTHLTPKYTEQGRPFLSAQNVKPFKFMPEKHRFVSEIDFDNYRANRRPERGDILMTRVGAGIGEAAVLDSDFEFAFYVSLCLIKIPNRLLSAQYIVLWLNSPEGRDSSTIRTYGKGASQGNLNLGLIRTFKVPLPPLAEQHRIVAKIDVLMALCDQLEASLDATATTRHRLLDALLAEALGPTIQRDAA
jgi:type I restriction enzyme S subunit